MDTELILINEFKKVKAKKWIATAQNSRGGVGLTFESELKKEPDSFMTPDFCDIEIKCSTKSSVYPFFLFSSSFDGPTFPEIVRLVKRYGWIDYKYLDRKILIIKANCCYINSPNKNGYKYKFKLDYENELLRLEIYDRYDKMIDDLSYVTFDTLKNHLECKLKKLAFVLAISKKIKEVTYFKYESMKLYKYKGFAKFLDLLEKGIIEISIVGRVSIDEKNPRVFRNKNMEFTICKEHLDKLYDCYYDSNDCI